MAIRARRSRCKGAPDPRLVVIDGEPTSSKGGTFYLEFKQNENGGRSLRAA
jgi:hypothetical protein